MDLQRTMSWGTELWDQFENLEKHTQWGIEFLEKYAKFIKERMEVEQTYAKQLRALVKKFCIKRPKEDDVRFSSCQSFYTMLNELNDYAAQREAIGEQMGLKIHAELLKCSQDLRSDRKRHIQEGKKATQYIEHCSKQMDASKKKFEREWKETEKLQLNYEKLESDANATKIEVDKAKAHMNARLHVVEECKNEYAAQLQHFNSEQRKHYTVSLPQILKNMQETDEKRAVTLGENYKCLAELERQASPVISKCLEGIMNAGNLVDPKKDSQLVVEQFKSGQEFPGDQPFEDFSQSVTRTRVRASSDGNTTVPKAEGAQADSKLTVGRAKNKLRLFGKKHGKNPMSLEDLHHLPPEQRRKKMQQRIDELNKELHKETEQRDGLLKMKDAYQENPQLGDAAILQPSISTTMANIDRLRADISKTENCLMELKGKQNSHIPFIGESGQNDTYDQFIPRNRNPSDPNEFDDDEFDSDDLSPPPSAGSCKALYAFDDPTEGSLGMSADEVLNVIDTDKGDGWTRVRNLSGQEGYVPTSYLEINGS